MTLSDYKDQANCADAEEVEGFGSANFDSLQRGERNHEQNEKFVGRQVQSENGRLKDMFTVFGSTLRIERLS